MPGKPEVRPQTLLPANQTTRFLKSSNLYNAKVASLDTYFILKEISSATDSVFTISRTAKAMNLNSSPLIKNFKMQLPM